MGYWFKPVTHFAYNIERADDIVTKRKTVNILSTCIAMSLLFTQATCAVLAKDDESSTIDGSVDCGSSYLVINDNEYMVGKHSECKVYTDFVIDAFNNSLDTEPILISNEGSYPIRISTGKFIAYDDSPKVVAVDHFEDWETLDSEETKSNIAFGFTGNNLDVWFDSQDDQDSKEMMIIEPKETVSIKLQSEFGLQWLEPVKFSYRCTLIAETLRDSDESSSENAKEPSEEELIEESSSDVSSQVSSSESESISETLSEPESISETLSESESKIEQEDNQQDNNLMNDTENVSSEQSSEGQ